MEIDNKSAEVLIRYQLEEIRQKMASLAEQIKAIEDNREILHSDAMTDIKNTVSDLWQMAETSKEEKESSEEETDIPYEEDYDEDYDVMEDIDIEDEPEEYEIEIDEEASEELPQINTKVVSVHPLAVNADYTTQIAEPQTEKAWTVEDCQECAKANLLQVFMKKFNENCKEAKVDILSVEKTFKDKRLQDFTGYLVQFNVNSGEFRQYATKDGEADMFHKLNPYHRENDGEVSEHGYKLLSKAIHEVEENNLRFELYGYADFLANKPMIMNDVPLQSVPNKVMGYIKYCEIMLKHGTVEDIEKTDGLNSIFKEKVEEIKQQHGLVSIQIQVNQQVNNNFHANEQAFVMPTNGMPQMPSFQANAPYSQVQPQQPYVQNYGQPPYPPQGQQPYPGQYPYEQMPYQGQPPCQGQYAYGQYAYGQPSPPPVMPPPMQMPQEYPKYNTVPNNGYGSRGNQKQEYNTSRVSIGNARLQDGTSAYFYFNKTTQNIEKRIYINGAGNQNPDSIPTTVADLVNTIESNRGFIKNKSLYYSLKNSLNPQYTVNTQRGGNSGFER